MLMEENPSREEILYLGYYLHLFRSQIENEPIESALLCLLDIGQISTVSDRQIRELVLEIRARNELDEERWLLPTWGGNL